VVDAPPQQLAPRLAGGPISAVLRERDPDYIRRSLPFAWPALAVWFRPEVRTLDLIALAADVPIVPVVSIGGQEAALFRRFRLKVPPVSLALPWGRDVGDVFGHIPLPAKITIQVLDLIDVHARFGPAPDVDTVSAAITALMQRTLDELAAQRRWPVIG
jgi:hypothetical protein